MSRLSWAVVTLRRFLPQPAGSLIRDGYMRRSVSLVPPPPQRETVPRVSNVSVSLIPPVHLRSLFAVELSCSWLLARPFESAQGSDQDAGFRQRRPHLPGSERSAAAI